MAAKILLSTTVNWPAPARLAGAFQACGATVEALAPRRHPVAESRALSKLYLYRPLQTLAGLRDALGASKPDLVIPCDDRAARHLTALAAADDVFAAIVARSIGRLESFGRLFSRSRFLAEAEGLGVVTPVTREVATEADLKNALHLTGLPAMIKTDGSWGGEGVSFASNFEDALAAFRHMALAPSRLRSLTRAAKRQDTHFLLQAAEPQSQAISVQQYVEGTAATAAFACWNGEVLASLHMEVVSSREPYGPASVLRRIESPQMDDAARRVAKGFALSGFHGLDFMRDGLGRPCLIEINPRATQICHLALGEGHDLPAALLAALESRAVAARPAATQADTIALFPQSLPHGPHLPGAYHDIPADDPGLLHALSLNKDMHSRGGSVALQNA